MHTHDHPTHTAPKHREDPRRAADRAGVRGKSAPPLDLMVRERIYRAQTGRQAKPMGDDPSTWGSWLRDDFTPRQRRRWLHKANRALVPSRAPRHDS